jgi:hypothetical protein
MKLIPGNGTGNSGSLKFSSLTVNCFPEPSSYCARFCPVMPKNVFLSRCNQSPLTALIVHISFSRCFIILHDNNTKLVLPRIIVNSHSHSLFPIPILFSPRTVLTANGTNETRTRTNIALWYPAIYDPGCFSLRTPSRVG